MGEVNLKKWAEEAYKMKAWLEQPQRKRDCFYNICQWGRCGYLCEVDDDECVKCKAFKYVPMGLESMIEGGFESINHMQHGAKGFHCCDNGTLIVRKNPLKEHSSDVSR